MVSFVRIRALIHIAIGCILLSGLILFTSFNGILVHEQKQKSTKVLQTLRALLIDVPQISMVLGRTCFEGALALFILFWHPVSLLVSPVNDPPLGLMMSCTILSAIIGSLAYTTLLGRFSNPELLVASPLLALLGVWIIRICCLHCIDVDFIFYFGNNVFALACGIYFSASETFKNRQIHNQNLGIIINLIRIPLHILIFIMSFLSQKPESAYGWAFFLIGASTIFHLIPYLRSVNDIKKSTFLLP